MIPITLTLSGFLSYREPVELDFTVFDVACISGPNGTGKSSLLDAITWALFGQARRRDDAIIHTAAEGAEVSLVFEYESNRFRVTRSKKRGKTAILEFQIEKTAGDWKPLTERTLRATESRIQETLRLDYETFTNAAFFLQGQADQFTQQRPGDRKRILSTILGLEVWEDYRQGAVTRRKTVQGNIDRLDGQTAEIAAELAEEATRRASLVELETNLTDLAQQRSTKEKTLETIQAAAAVLAEQEKLVLALHRQLEAAETNLSATESRLDERRAERESHNNILVQAETIEGGYKNWQAARIELERCEETAATFREGEQRRRAPLESIAAERARLEESRASLQNRLKDEVEPALTTLPQIKEQITIIETQVEAAKTRQTRRQASQEALNQAQEQSAEARAENGRFKAEMDDLKSRIDRLEETDGADCPLCGQPLSQEERIALIQRLKEEGQGKGDAYRANQALVEVTSQQVRELQEKISALKDADKQMIDLAAALQSQMNQRQQIETLQTEWKTKHATRLAALETNLEQEAYAKEARVELQEVDAELQAIGYETAAHDAVRKQEAEGRPFEEQLRRLENARAAAAPLEREIAGLEEQAQTHREALATLSGEYTQAAASLAAAQAAAPDLRGAERDLLTVQERENQLRLEVGAAQQKVDVLADLKIRREVLESQREDLAGEIGRLKVLEQAFGKNGVPALLIEQALPQIETKANETLERLSGGEMSVRFITQAKFKDAKRDDLRETLEIQISDRAGLREYELYSGGESFRINFAIRLALSEMLAQRAGARLQTLVIDEGFGSQDILGRQRLVEAINTVKDDFAKILVITHIEELKDAFPTRIEVSKTPHGSKIEVI